MAILSDTRYIKISNIFNLYNLWVSLLSGGAVDSETNYLPLEIILPCFYLCFFVKFFNRHIFTSQKKLNAHFLCSKKFFSQLLKLVNLYVRSLCTIFSGVSFLFMQDSLLDVFHNGNREGVNC